VPIDVYENIKPGFRSMPAHIRLGLSWQVAASVSCASSLRADLPVTTLLQPALVPAPSPSCCEAEEEAPAAMETTADDATADSACALLTLSLVATTVLK
jgi:hypothetical protein